MPHWWVCSPVEQLQPFEWDHIVGLQEAEWTYRQIVARVGHDVLVVCCCFQQWSMEHSHTHRPSSWWLCRTDARQDRSIVRVVVIVQTVFREEIWAHVAPAVLPKNIENCLLQQDSDHVCLWAGYHLHHDTAKHDYSDVVKEFTGEWNGALLSSVMRVGSVCMWVMDIHVYGVDLVSIIIWIAFPHETQAYFRLHGVGDHQLQLMLTFGVSAG